MHATVAKIDKYPEIHRKIWISLISHIKVHARTMYNTKIFILHIELKTIVRFELNCMIYLLTF